MFCAKCGQKIEDDSKFCRGCGTATVMTAEALPVDVDVNAEPAQPPVFEPGTQAMQKKSRKNKVIFLIVAAILVLAVAGALFYENLPQQKAAHTAQKVMSLLKDKSLDVLKYCSDPDLPDSAGYIYIDIFSAKLTSCKNIGDRPDVQTTTKHSWESQSEFDEEKDMEKLINVTHGPYKIQSESDSELILIADNLKVHNYMVEFDVMYSDLMGNDKHTLVDFVMTEDKYQSNNYLVTRIFGLEGNAQ